MDYRDAFCVDDKRNPMYADLHWDGDNVEHRDGCACDNCFYGRHEMACEIAALKAKLAEAEAKLAVVKDEVNHGWRWCDWEDIQDAVGFVEEGE